MQKASLPKGVRDFEPSVLRRRKQILSVITAVYEKYGFEPLETPAMENLATLTGKYGDEGDQLLFKILNSGNYLRGVESSQFDDPKKLTSQISDKGLRYDLTIPFARFVVQNQHLITFPFKRYQIQPVWRADKPQKGRYREFWQCDADVIGTSSLLCEADFVKIYEEVFSHLGLEDYELRINHRKLLEAMAKTVGYAGSLPALTISIDKLGKIGRSGVEQELQQSGLSAKQSAQLMELMKKQPLHAGSIAEIEKLLTPCSEREVAVAELTQLVQLLGSREGSPHVFLDLSLARGLDYYTGCIFEASLTKAQMGSVSGGGRYDNLTGMFGLNGISGVGISFGLDRLYDVMFERNLFQDEQLNQPHLILCHFDPDSFQLCVQIADMLRKSGLTAEVYPDFKNIRKQMEYANKRRFQFVGLVGETELKDQTVQLKHMTTGNQISLPISELANHLS